MTDLKRGWWRMDWKWGIGRLWSKSVLEDRGARWHPLLFLSGWPLWFSYRVGWSQLFIFQRGIAQHISYSSLTCWEEMTLLTVNYSQPISPLQCCGLFISDLTLLSVPLLLLLGEFSISTFWSRRSACKATKVGYTLSFPLATITT